MWHQPTFRYYRGLLHALLHVFQTLPVVRATGTTTTTNGALAELSANLTIHATSVIPILSPGKLFGSFWEEFRHAGEGGIYAEKIRNRALQLPIIHTQSNEEGWIVVQGHVHRDDSKPLNAILQHALWLRPTSSQPAAVVRNTGFPGGMAVMPGEELQLSLFLYVDNSNPKDQSSEPGSGVTLEASLVTNDKENGSINSTIANATVLPSTQQWNDSNVDRANETDGWKKVVVTMTVPKNEHYAARNESQSIPCQFQLQALLLKPPQDHHCKHNNTAFADSYNVSIGVTVVSLVSITHSWNGLLRHDVLSWLRESTPPFVRLPGGCYVEGLHWGGRWNWKQTIGLIEERPGHYNDKWGYFTSDGLGMLEYLTMAQTIGAKPLLVVNAGCTMTSCVTMDDDSHHFVQDAVDAVEFAMGDPATTYWGAQRAAAGHYDPIPLEALGIGNENCRPLLLLQYARNWLHIAVAVRRHYPDLPLVLGCESPQQMQTVLELEPRIRQMTNLMYDIHRRHDPASFLQHAHYFDAFPRRTADLPTVFVSEYSSPRSVFPNGVDLGGAVAEAIYMMGMEANSDVVRMASYGDLMENIHDADTTASGISTILLDATGSVGTPSWVVQTLFMQHQPHGLVTSSLFNVTLLHNQKNKVGAVSSSSALEVSSWRNGGTAWYGKKKESMLTTSVSLLSDSHGGRIVVKVANHGHATARLYIQLKGNDVVAKKDAVLHWISSDENEPKDQNTMDDPRRIRIRQRTVPVVMKAGSTLVELLVSPFSVSALEIPRQKPHWKQKRSKSSINTDS
ncbi:Alpha-L-arabinofuranosidase A [Seminavis robusta]|uniref:non-reducing end alpha-L-arabinofuranosidase n=1 Tax=Seminavis robusta TaxID=568900 RepID=A0A9N8EY78_9STRA|nr:Alpha-L-arabinofuranosidase A [Seminavis robusta]|eukprot:Sro1912_g304990.1 Alpha-L-arabinofuranosidase A (793) ;mRNA; f:11684-14062